MKKIKEKAKKVRTCSGCGLRKYVESNFGTTINGNVKKKCNECVKASSGHRTCRKCEINKPNSEYHVDYFGSISRICKVCIPVRKNNLPAKTKRLKKNDDPTKVNIISREARMIEKADAKTVLEVAKKQTAEKLDSGKYSFKPANSGSGLNMARAIILKKK